MGCCAGKLQFHKETKRQDKNEYLAAARAEDAGRVLPGARRGRAAAGLPRLVEDQDRPELGRAAVGRRVHASVGRTGALCCGIGVLGRRHRDGRRLPRHRRRAPVRGDVREATRLASTGRDARAVAAEARRAVPPSDL
ncbi:unnamed protein product [Pelagomonas calceolata]|uniref:Uncharacterized protein n=1 Tax=Pelagomonas calceolata TaxID=35677 RepID=A0A8J2SGC8_9STRA|nr:unnamed protein product [Pelagomonas calceolata]